MKSAFSTIVILIAGMTQSTAAELPRIDVPASAYGEGSFEGDDPRVEVRLISDHDALAPGDTARIGVLFHADPDWHFYWRNSGESGMSTDVSLRSAAFAPTPLFWPAPTVFVDPSGQVATFGYGDAELLWVGITAPSDFATETQIDVDVSWLACKVDCIPGDATLSLRLAAGHTTRSGHFDLFEAAATRLPENLTSAFRGPTSPVRPSQVFEATLEIPAQIVPAPARRFDVMPDDTPGIAWTVTSTEIGATSVLRLRGEAQAGHLTGPCALSAVVWTTQGPRRVHHAVACGEEAKAALLPDAGSATPTPGGDVSLPLALLLGFLGGVLLNLMPCVFPVLALKAFGVMKNAHEPRGHALRHASAYSAGILAAMIALASVVVALKAAGTHVGWGFQFQEPWFVWGLASVLVVFAANLFGAFEFTVSVSKQGRGSAGLTGSMMEGVLAVILATPCSAPMLGTAVGFALASPAANIFAVFVAVGLGLAAPFVAFAAVPALAARLPKPGAWMNTFKRGLGFALLGAVAWLVWILAGVLGGHAVGGVLGALVGIAAAAWVWGLAQFGTARARIVAGLAAAVIVATSVAILPPMQVTTANAPHDSEWGVWSPDAVDEALASGRPVFVDFTADWCITCKVNENGVLKSTEVKDAFSKHNVVKLKADWTRRDESIRAELARFGKAGVPLYVLHRPGAPPEVLPELLTASMVREALDAKP